MRRLLTREASTGDTARAEIIVRRIRATHGALGGEPLPEVGSDHSPTFMFGIGHSISEPDVPAGGIHLKS